MKITISRSQWQEIGKTAGWIQAAKLCNECGALLGPNLKECPTCKRNKPKEQNPKGQQNYKGPSKKLDPKLPLPTIQAGMQPGEARQAGIDAFIQECIKAGMDTDSIITVLEDQYNIRPVIAEMIIKRITSRKKS